MPASNPIFYKHWLAEKDHGHWRLGTPCGDDHAISKNWLGRNLEQTATDKGRLWILKEYVDSGRAGKEHHCTEEQIRKIAEGGVGELHPASFFMVLGVLGLAAYGLASMLGKG